MDPAPPSLYRSLEAPAECEAERTQALRLVRACMSVSPADVPREFVSALSACMVPAEKAMASACIETMCELGMQHVSIIDECGVFFTAIC